MNKLLLIILLFALVGCKNPNLVEYRYEDKDGNVHIEYIDKDILEKYNNSKK